MPNETSGGRQPPLFSFRRESLRYRAQPILNNVELDIYAGESVALVGKSGAGKSTLLKALRQQQSRSVAWCPQDCGLVPSLSVFHNVYMGGLNRHNVAYNLLVLLKPPGRPVAEISTLLDKLHLPEKLWTPVSQLSGGQQQRVSIGRALFQRQPIFLGDEPVSSLDRYQADALLTLIACHHPTRVLALHDTEQALQTCSRIIGLRAGHIVLDSPAAEVSQRQLGQLYV